MRSPISIGDLPISTAFVYDDTRECSLYVISTGFCSVLDTAEMYSGVVPQHPPIMRTPLPIRALTSSANSSGDTLNTVLPSLISGNPAFGISKTGTDAYSRSSSTTPVSCFGPSEQFAPIASAPMPSSIATIAAGVAPVIKRLSLPYAFETNTGREEFSLAAKRAALVS